MDILTLYIELTKTISDPYYSTVDDFIDYLEEVKNEVCNIRKNHSQQEIEKNIRDEFQYMAENLPREYLNNFPISATVEIMVNNLINNAGQFPSEYKIEVIPFIIAFRINKELFQL